jgi:hypothetical protein
VAGLAADLGPTDFASINIHGGIGSSDRHLVKVALRVDDMSTCAPSHRAFKGIHADGAVARDEGVTGDPGCCLHVASVWMQTSDLKALVPRQRDINTEAFVTTPNNTEVVFTTYIRFLELCKTELRNHRFKLSVRLREIKREDKEREREKEYFLSIQIYLYNNQIQKYKILRYCNTERYWYWGINTAILRYQYLGILPHLHTGILKYWGIATPLDGGCRHLMSWLVGGAACCFV